MPSTILIVDDDPHIRQLLVFAFGKAGLGTIEAADGEQALAEVERHAPDLVILDINMPRMDGLEVCRRLRAQNDVPIFFLSSRDDEIDRVLGIELGGDDYVVKPFSPREVVARSMAILRRTAARPPVVENVGVMRHGLLSLDTESWSAHWGMAEVGLTVTEFTILRTLLAMPSRIFSRDQIIDRFRGPGFALTDRTVDSHIRNLRRKFSDVGGIDLIETRAGIGYRLGACGGTDLTA
ncbi:two-component system response regulator CreB [Sphingobium sp. LB126]|uniref:response regulator transcription factor n=1 Tax=Sphingobium sp. LB126 TaxID=1983755 RepID=UPI000C20B166|nr:response regulator transcription factor [Sphingobium sp. LB126]PJG46599.1 two-component system response regulator CreB [Sphingobium sp. LB126]